MSVQATVTYSHTQTGSLHLVFLPFAGLFLGSSFLVEPLLARLLLLGVGGLFVFLCLSMAQLTIRGAGDRLVAAFGPLPLFRRTVRYADIRSFSIARSHWVDGWGVHWFPGRGWTWNLWGRDCVELDLGGRTLRLGTDDPHGLASHLASLAPGSRES